VDFFHSAEDLGVLIRLRLHIDIVILQDHGKSLYWLCGWRRQRFSGSQIKTSTMQRALDRLSVNLSLRQ
jgi:hypothetical protein